MGGTNPQGAVEQRTKDEKKRGRERTVEERLFCILLGYWKMTVVFDASHGAFALDCVSLNVKRRTG